MNIETRLGVQVDHSMSQTTDDKLSMKGAWSVLKFFSSLNYLCLQCFDAVGWASGRASGL